MKAIYGLAMPFNDSYIDRIHVNNEFRLERTNKESITFDRLVGATLGHDYSKSIGVTRENLQFEVTDDGVFFKLIPLTPLGIETFEQVRDGKLRQCSISYVVKKKKRDHEAETKLKQLTSMLGWNDTCIVYQYTEIKVFEICLTNYPANENTFCTTNPNHPLLAGIDWTIINKGEMNK